MDEIVIIAVGCLLIIIFSLLCYKYYQRNQLENNKYGSDWDNEWNDIENPFIVRDNYSYDDEDIY